MTDRHDQDETASLVSQILQTYHEHCTVDEHARQPLTYDEAITGNITDQMDRYRDLASMTPWPARSPSGRPAAPTSRTSTSTRRSSRR